MYAVIETGGKQYKVSQGDNIFVEKLDTAEGESVEFKVIAYQDDNNGLMVGSPYLEKAKVFGKVIKNGKGKKIMVFTYKPKKSCKRKMGHRQPYSKVQIETMTSDASQYD